MKIFIRNDYHKTEVFFSNLTRECEVGGKKGYEISVSAYKKIKKRLCNDQECECGITYKSPYKIHTDRNETGKVYYLLRK